MNKLLAVALLVIANAASAETIWVTKYVLTRGIQKYESAQLFADGQVAVVARFTLNVVNTGLMSNRQKSMQRLCGNAVYLH